LEISGNQIRKIEGLGNLRKLENLDLQHNLIKEIEGLQDLSRLKYITLSSNPFPENLKEIIKEYGTDGQKYVKYCQRKYREYPEQKEEMNRSTEIKKMNAKSNQEVTSLPIGSIIKEETNQEEQKEKSGKGLIKNNEEIMEVEAELFKILKSFEIFTCAVSDSVSKSKSVIPKYESDVIDSIRLAKDYTSDALELIGTFRANLEGEGEGSVDGALSTLETLLHNLQASFNPMETKLGEMVTKIVRNLTQEMTNHTQNLLNILIQVQESLKRLRKMKVNESNENLT
jgi:Leucine-rich repeat (LRR) protein